jgi:hypothetical protein
MFSAASFVQVKKGSVGVAMSEKKANLFYELQASFLNKKFYCRKSVIDVKQYDNGEFT